MEKVKFHMNLKQERSYTPYYIIPLCEIGKCSNNNELAVYIHGVWTQHIAVKEHNMIILSIN
jgi:hypothetical protein